MEPSYKVSSASKISIAFNSAVSAATAGRSAYLPSEICMDAMRTGLYTRICEFKCYCTHTNTSKSLVVFLTFVHGTFGSCGKF